MSGAPLRGLGLVAAILAVIGALWVLRDRGRAGSSPSPAEPGAATDRGAGGHRGPAGVGAREITVAGDGVVEGHVIDEDGVAVTEGQLVLWCLANDGTVARIRDGVLPLDDEGHFRGPACRGEVCPELRHSSQIPASPWSLRPGTHATLDTRALPRLWGRVIDPEGQAVAAAQVAITHPADDDDPTAALPVVGSRTSTDADGEFSMALIERPPCDPCQQMRGACLDDPLPVLDRVLVTARAEGWAPGAQEVDLVDAQDEDQPFAVSLRAAEPAITGRLVDAAGAAVPRAVVLARSELRTHEQHRAELTETEFVFEALAPGPYAVRVIQDGIELLRREGVEPGATLELQLPVALHGLVVRLVDEQGTPRAGVGIEGGPFVRQRTDDEGRVTAHGVAPGAYILRIRPPGGRGYAQPLEVPAWDRDDPVREIPVIVP